MVSLAYKNIDLIKKYNLVRDYMREFFVYGFKYRGNIGEKSDRTCMLHISSIWLMR